ncbi:hypothetical protein BBOV_II004755 [Babesia bovis T2Bo]|uniref:hypothetical protein n=1 Tax=Babesia bovis T2Bo TaxID=484906 RepID=UPI001C364D23|nr:hypothetical protein BBOV_II004755 [Babesia bovis T2Bo]KAG6440118.1 hypothetical protein BBOV_II004755 [Babesia bovis T2Bo]
MSNSAKDGIVTGTTEDSRIYVLVALNCSNPDVLSRVCEKTLEIFLKANILLQFGVVGYLEFPVHVVHKFNDEHQFVIRTSNRNVTRLMLLVADRFPLKLPIPFTEYLQVSDDIFLRIVKCSTNLWNLK